MTVQVHVMYTALQYIQHMASGTGRLDAMLNVLHGPSGRHKQGAGCMMQQDGRRDL